jgi:hypothetical protein
MHGANHNNCIEILIADERKSVRTYRAAKAQASVRR